MTRTDLLLLPGLARFGDAAVLALRALTGTFLIYGVWDNITSAEQMAEFEGFLGASGFPMPALMAPLSVWAQFVCGALFIPGLLTRWAGLVMVFNFIVAVTMVHWSQDFRNWWPAIVLVAISLLLATQGAGRYSVDAALARRR